MRQYIFFTIAILAISFEISAQYTFTAEKSLKYTPVQDQQSTNTCWSFATTSLLESELLRETASPVNLSEMYIVRQIYLDKARKYLLSEGKTRFAEGGLSHDVIHATSTYGAIPEDVYPGRESLTDVHNHSELVVVLKAVLDGMLSVETVSEKWTEVFNAILDVYLGPVPEKFTIGTHTFTPGSYAESLDLDMSDYVSITSYMHHPFYHKFVLDIPDNHANAEYYNVTIDDLLRITNNAVEKGYSIAWDGDVSENAFSAVHGIAVLPETEREDVLIVPGKEKVISQTERQQQFENKTTTDDHLMHLTGSALDQNGNRYFILKNSWGEIGEYSGILHMSEPYFLAKTIAIMVHRDAIPTDIAAKMIF
jgi:bleomycin hydrolase